MAEGARGISFWQTPVLRSTNSTEYHALQIGRIFDRMRDRREAHRLAAPLLEELSADPRMLTEALGRCLSHPSFLNTRHYPVIAIPIAESPHFTLVANCWLPLPNSETNLSTKAIHHHGILLLTTVTAFGPGYEHWMFERPQLTTNGLYATRLLDRSRHHPHHALFVDSYVAHCPFYPPSLSITFALWSSKNSSSWLDAVRRWRLAQRYRSQLVRLAQRLGQTESLGINVIQDFDFFPVDGGLRALRDRIEFDLGSNIDFLYSLFHVLQLTGNEGLASIVRERLAKRWPIENRPLVERLLQILERGETIRPRLSSGHYDIPHSNFSREAILQALGISDGCKEV